MPTKVLTAKHPEQAVLIPADDDAAESLKAYKVGETFEITTTVLVTKTKEGSLRGDSEADEQFLARYGAGELVEIVANKKRNLKHHRLAMLLLRAVFDNQDKYLTFEAFLNEVKILTGHCKMHISSNGQVFWITQSIAFDRMDEIEFRKWKNSALNEVIQHFIPDMPKADQDRLINHIFAVG